jgi:hypothetical protein
MNPILSQLNPVLNFMSHFTNINFVRLDVYNLIRLQTKHYRPIPHVQESYEQKGDQAVTSPPPKGDTQKNG